MIKAQNQARIAKHILPCLSKVQNYVPIRKPSRILLMKAWLKPENMSLLRKTGFFAVIKPFHYFELID